MFSATYELIMNVRLIKRVVTLACLLFSVSLAYGSEKNSDKGLWFFVLVKSNNYSQSVNGDLTLLNYHFFSEIFAKEDGVVKSASLQRAGDERPAFTYEDKGGTYYYEGGHFDTVDEVDAAHPNGSYRFQIELSKRFCWLNFSF